MLLKEIAYSTSSACVLKNLNPHMVLRALGLSVIEAQSSNFVFHLDVLTSLEDVEVLIAILCREIPEIVRVKRG